MSLESIISFEYNIYTETKRSNLKDSQFGISDKRKFPLDTENHVRSAIKFFNYADKEDEKELAGKIKSAMKRYDIDDVKISDDNRLSQYISESSKDGYVIEKEFYVYDKNGTENKCLMVKGYDRPLRHRGEMIVFKNDKIFCHIKRNGFIRFTGGGVERGESGKEAAIRETKEEARLLVKNVKDYGVEITYFDTPKKWVINSIENEKDRWTGYYSEIFCGEFNGIYKGKVASEDVDDLISKGSWKSIDYVLQYATEKEKEAIRKYIGK